MKTATELSKESQKFIPRYLKESTKQKVDNQSLYTGSPMYFYCQGCTTEVAVLPEGYTTPPPHFCAPCQYLDKHEALQQLLELAHKKKNDKPTRQAKL